MAKCCTNINIRQQCLAVTGVKITSMCINQIHTQMSELFTSIIFSCYHNYNTSCVCLSLTLTLTHSHRDMIATGCEDKNVRVYYLATSSDQPLKVFTGHTAKVFHVRWSPLREGILCSGSDDG